MNYIHLTKHNGLVVNNCYPYNVISMCGAVYPALRACWGKGMTIGRAKIRIKILLSCLASSSYSRDKLFQFNIIYPTECKILHMSRTFCLSQ